jgi:hypothetical protein
VSAHRDRAVALLVNYLEAIARKAGMKWDADYTAEIGEAVDAIIEAAVDLTPSREQRDRETDERLVNLYECHAETVRRLDKHERQLREGAVKFDLHEDRQRRDGGR